MPSVDPLWSGKFGLDWAERNKDEGMDGRVDLFKRVFDLCEERPRSILEVGASIGNNLRAIRSISDADLYAVEPNEFLRLRLIEGGVIPAPMLVGSSADKIDLTDGQVEMAFTYGCLIHIGPDHLDSAMAEIHRVAGRYIFCAEYFSPDAREIEYADGGGHLWARDYGRIWLNWGSWPNLKLLGYGFEWKHDTGLDDIHWWLFKK